MIKLLFTGDLLPADCLTTLGVGIGSKLDNKELLWSEEISELFCSADFACINLEAPLLKNYESIKNLPFAGNPNVLKHLVESGITHANIANNHILEHNIDAFINTTTLLHAHGIKPIGVQQDHNSKIVLSRKNSIEIAFAGFNAIHDINNPSCYAELTENAIISTLTDPKMKAADFRILTFHWGNEYVHIPSLHQIGLARLSIEHGANLIIGHHPHVIQPIEVYKKGLICYSLGNFVFDMLWSKSVRTGLIVEIDVNKSGISKWKVHGCRYNRSYRVSLLPARHIEEKLKKFNVQKTVLLSKGDEEYNRSYFKTVKINRLLARILMKLQLTFMLYYISRQNRIVILKSIFSKLKHKLFNTGNYNR